MKLLIPAGSTSVIGHVFIQDTAVTDGGGKTGLLFSGMNAYYVRAGGTLTLMTMVEITTLGTWDADVTADKLGFKELNAANAPGIYEIHFPNNILAAGANSVVIQLRAAGAAPCNIGIQLAGVDLDAAYAAAKAAAKAGDAMTLTGDYDAAKSAAKAGDAMVVSDKTGFALVEDYDLAKTAAQPGDAMVVSDKTGFALTEDYDLAKTAAQPGDAMVVSDKTGFALTADYDLAKTAAQPGDAMAVSDKTGFSLSADYDPAKTAAQPGDAMAITSLPDIAISDEDISTIRDGLATAEVVATIDGIVDAIKAKTDTLGGAGGISWTYTLTEISTGLPIADATIWVTTDILGRNIVATGKTDVNGIVSFTLDADTYYIWRQKAGWNFTNPDTEVVST